MCGLGSQETLRPGGSDCPVQTADRKHAAGESVPAAVCARFVNSICKEGGEEQDECEQ